MKLVIATTAATILGIAAFGQHSAFAQEAESTGEEATPASSEAADSEDAGAAAPVDPAAQPADAAVQTAATDPLIAKVADYALFQRDLNAIRTRVIEEPEDLDAVMDMLVGYESGTLTDAFYSYAAFVGAQQPAFVDGLKQVAEHYGVDQVVQGMLNEPEYVLTFPGAGPAADLVLGVVREDVAALSELSEHFKQESYDLQTRGWSDMIADDRDERLSAIRQPKRLTTPTPDMLANVASGAPISSADATAADRRAAFWSAVDYRVDPQQAPVTPAPANQSSETVGVMMTLAALRALDVSQTRPDLVTHLLNLPTAKSCLDFALLHLEQCVAAGHFKYEDAFCIAEHQLLDMSQCLGETVGTAMMTPAPAAPSTAPAETAPAAAEAVATTTETPATPAAETAAAAIAEPETSAN
jgi:hypothetical protein